MTARAQRVCGGVFTADPAVPPDPLTGRRACVCRLVGEPGDAHHTLPDVPEQQESRRRAGDDSDEGVAG